jgi:cytochrome c-type biogenesis protein CcmH
VRASASESAVEERVKRIGKKLLCLCGCNQILVECNHRNCPFSGPALTTLRQAVQRYESDDLAIQAMIQQYGTAVLAAPPAQGFNLAAWITPFAAAAGGLVFIALVLRRWSRRSATAPMPSPALSEDPAWRERVRREIERELGGSA